MKFLVHLHIYYHDQADYFIEKLSNIEGCEWDLFVTYSQENEETFEKLKRFKPDTIFIKVDNLGYDVWPFIQVIRKVNLDDYDYVLKLHTKNCQRDKEALYGKDGYFWRDKLIDPLIGSKRRFKKNISILTNNKNIGLLGGRVVYLGMTNFLPEDTFLIYGLQKRLGIQFIEDHFIAGTMFIIKSDVLKIIVNSDISSKDFEIISKTNEVGTIAHALERIFSLLPSLYNYETYLVDDLFCYRDVYKKILRFIFSLTNTPDGRHKIIEFMGIKLKIKRKVKFAAGAVEYESILTPSESVNFKFSRAAVFATFFKDGKISDNNIRYLKEVKNYTDYIIFVSDNPVLLSEIDKIRGIVDLVICIRHEEYDFGSYKRGYFKLKELGIWDKINSLLFFNDSVVLDEGENLNDLFCKSHNKDFYGVLSSNQGFYIKERLIQNNHIQSWFVIMSDRIFKTDWFENFINSIKKENTKQEIVANYEVGMSKLITDNEFEINSYYPPCDDTRTNPDVLYANPKKCFKGRLFIKKRFLKKC